MSGWRMATVAWLLLGAVAWSAPAGVARGQDSEDGAAPADSTGWEEAEGADEAPSPPPRVEELTGPWPRFAAGPDDTVRTNLWLVRALLADAVAEAAAVLPPAPRAVVVKPVTRSDGNALLVAAATTVLQERGYEVYLDETTVADAKQAAVAPTPPAGALELRLSIETLRLGYPRAGRRFGLWRQWVDRDLRATLLATGRERDTGRILFDRRLERAFADRVASARFDEVRSPGYPFTDAVVPEGGWRRHAEEAVVIGTLVGLVAIYFANTGS